MERDTTRIYCRLKSIKLTNFRNIEHGSVEFPNGKIEEFVEGSPSLLGLYGQNGSGKTSLIMSLGILKRALCGQPINNNYRSAIREGSETSTLTFEFSLYDDDGYQYQVSYSFSLRVEQEESDVDDDQSDGNAFTDVIRIYDEVIRYQRRSPEGSIIDIDQILIDTHENASKRGWAFGNDAKYSQLINNNKEIHQKLREIKAVAFAKSKSFVFGAQFLDLMKKQRVKDEHKHYHLLLAALRQFGGPYLHIIDTTSTGVTNLKSYLPLVIWRENRETVLFAQYMLELRGTAKVPEDIYEPTMNAIQGINTVLRKIVPNLEIVIKDCGTSKDIDGDDMHLLKLHSKRNGIEIPLQYESDGIRRIISILSLLIAVYNQPSMTVAIDEIDSGIYEYLLGEILQVMSESARGQLVFTSHNLRPLEVIPRKFLCFTTVNQDHRFAKLEASGNNNLRDCYYRSIILGGEGDAIYQATDRYDIDTAFFEAGEPSEC